MKRQINVINPEISQIVKDVVKEYEEGSRLPISDLILKIQARCREKNLECPTDHNVRKYFYKAK
jgi:hypothetical protein